MPEADLSLILYGLLIGLLAGGVGGTLAGLAGIGGGLIYVPLFYACMPGHDDAGSMATAIFASMVAVACTGFFSARSHWRLQHVDPTVLKHLLPGLIIGAGFGLWSTVHLPHGFVLLALAGLNAWIAFDYGRSSEGGQLGSASLMFASGPIGVVSGMFGIGGGTMLVPLLRRVVALRFAIGTAAMCGFVMALSALLLNLLLESSWQVLLSGRLPFLFGLWAGILLILPLTTRTAARLHEMFDEPEIRLLLKMLFALLAILLVASAIYSA